MKDKSLDSNNSFLGEYKCSSLALDKEERRGEKEEIGSLETKSNNIDDVGRMYACSNCQHFEKMTLLLHIPVYKIELSVGEEDLLTLEVPAVKNSSYKGPNRRFNSCCDGAVVSANGEHFIVGARGQSCHNLTPFVIGE
ncbi:hypothetical protein Tco_0666845 [Tanacetum coccineum]